MNEHMGSQTTGQAHPKLAAHSLPKMLEDVALIAAPVCAGVGSVSVSYWHEEVRAGRAPQPVVRAPRCTRWRVIDVVDFWAKFAEQAQGKVEAASAVVAKATKASAAAKAKRTTDRSGANA